MLSVTRHNRRDATLVRCGRSPKCSTDVLPMPGAAICPFRSPVSCCSRGGMSEMMRGWQTDGQTDRRHSDRCAHQSRRPAARYNALGCRVFYIIARLLACPPGHWFSSCRVVRVLLCQSLVNRLRVVGRMIDRRLIASSCCERYSSAEPVPHKRITSRIPPSRARLFRCIMNV